MPGWVVTVLLAGLVALVLAGVGGADQVVIMIVMIAWFVVLAGLALAAETAVQAVGRLFRR